MLKDAHEDLVVGMQPKPKSTPIIDLASVFRYYIERHVPNNPFVFSILMRHHSGLVGVGKAQVDIPIFSHILRRTEVLDDIFLSKKCDIHLEV